MTDQKRELAGTNGITKAGTGTLLLGGVSIFGGSGSMLGVVLSTFLVLNLRNGMSLAGVNGNTQTGIVGLLLEQYRSRPVGVRVTLGAGTVVGESDSQAAYVKDRPVSPADSADGPPSKLERAPHTEFE